MKAISELLKRPVAYQPILAKAFGSVSLALLWSQVYYWSGKGANKEGWIYKSRTELFDETGLTRTMQENARKDGEALGVLQSKRMGHPCTVHFRIDVEKTAEVIEKYIDSLPAKGQRELKIKKEPAVEVKKEADPVNLIFQIFYDTINPNIGFGNKTQRAAADWLIKKHGLEKIINATKYAVSIQGDKYAPTITKPSELKEKMAAMIKYKTGQEQGNGKSYQCKFNKWHKAGEDCNCKTENQFQAAKEQAIKNCKRGCDRGWIKTEKGMAYCECVKALMTKQNA